MFGPSGLYVLGHIKLLFSFSSCWLVIPNVAGGYIDFTYYLIRCEFNYS